jgi:hypothetical protein
MAAVPTSIRGPPGPLLIGWTAGPDPEGAGPGGSFQRQEMPAAVQAFCRSGVVQTLSFVVNPSAMTSFTVSL